MWCSGGIGEGRDQSGEEEVEEVKELVKVEEVKELVEVTEVEVRTQWRKR